jgi:phage repressor protein C with HTH and peptisase S24 domain
MLPRIADGDILHVHPADPAGIRVGDIVIFKADQGCKAHRVIARYGPIFFTRGDAAQDYDLPIRGDEILGRVVAKECPSSGSVTKLCSWRERLRFLRTRMRNLLR